MWASVTVYLRYGLRLSALRRFYQADIIVKTLNLIACGRDASAGTKNARSLEVAA
jgi:hypothetical protein